MKNLITMTIFATMSFATFASDLEDAQKQIINLQNEKIKLIQAITKTYSGNGICYAIQNDCISKQESLNKALSLLGNEEISLSTICTKYIPASGSICENSPYKLTISVKISPDISK